MSGYARTGPYFISKLKSVISAGEDILNFNRKRIHDGLSCKSASRLELGERYLTVLSLNTSCRALSASER